MYPVPPLTMAANGSSATLLVDDDPWVRQVCRRALELDHVTVLEAGDGQEALCLIQEWPGQLDLVITDLRMPRIDGRELAEVLSVFRPELPVLAITADPEQIDRRLPILAKPFDLDELVEAARLVRNQAKQTRPWAVERRRRTMQARQLAEEMWARSSALQKRVNLVAIAWELQRRCTVASSTRANGFR
jgi:CheY-like chemotaxis protein